MNHTFDAAFGESLFFSIIYNVKFLDEHMYFKYRTMRSFSVVRFWVEG